MSRYSRILEKAKLEQDLFGSEPTSVELNTFPTVDTASPSIDEPQQPEISSEQPVVASLEAAIATAPPQTSEDDSGASVSWREELGQILGLDRLPDDARLAVCPLGSLKSGAESAAALGQWIAARSSGNTLLVEASFDSPHLARLFRTRRLGLAEAMAAREPRWDHFVHDTFCPRLKVLPAGRNPGMKHFVNTQDAFCETLASLSKSFSNVIVVLPNPRVRGFERIAISKAADVVLPVFQPGKLTAGQARRAVKKMASGSARVAAAVIAPQHVISDVTRMEQIAKQLGEAARGEYA